MPISSKWYAPDLVTDHFRYQSTQLVSGSDEKQIEWIKTVPGMQVLDAPNLDQICHNYALTKILGSDPLSNESGDPISKQMTTTLDHLFTPIANPQNGDLVVYYCHKLANPILTHSGIVRDHDLVESKWGDIPAIFIHPTFFTYYLYGEEVRYFTPKK